MVVSNEEVMEILVSFYGSREKAVEVLGGGMVVMDMSAFGSMLYKAKSIFLANNGGSISEKVEAVVSGGEELSLVLPLSMMPSGMTLDVLFEAVRLLGLKDVGVVSCDHRGRRGVRKVGETSDGIEVKFCNDCRRII